MNPKQKAMKALSEMEIDCSEPYGSGTCLLTEEDKSEIVDIVIGALRENKADLCACCEEYESDPYSFCAFCRDAGCQGLGCER